jgi:gamma-glutamyltranspeptidase/glutathione hydrolase
MLLQVLRILDGFDLVSLGHNTSGYLHTLTEAIKLAAADRERYFGDPRFIDVPLQRLLSEPYVAARRKQIHPNRAWPDMPPPGGALEAAASAAGLPNEDAAMDTSYVCVVDGAGNVFSATPSDGSYNSPVIPGLGIVVSPRGQQSWADPSHPSCVAPGKRPRLTPNPAIALSRDRIIPFGSPGGDVQTQAMLQALLNHIVFGFDVQAAVELPRVASYSFPSSFEPHQSEPGVLRAEARLPEEALRGLKDRGHKVEAWPDFTWLAGSVSMIDADRGRGSRRGASDPRRMGYAVGW